VNGNPLYYYKNQNGLDIDGLPIGELLLVNCSAVNVSNLKINNSDIGVELAYSSNINITNNNFTSNNYGIYLFDSSENVIKNNIIFAKNERFVGNGINLMSSSNNNISNNTILFWWRGINFRESPYNEISHNTVSKSSYSGIHLAKYSNYTTIYNNSILRNGDTGLRIVDSSDITINSNIASENGNQGIEIGQSMNNKIEDNIVSNNSYVGIYLWDTVYFNLTGNIMTENGLYLGGNSLESWNSHDIDTTNLVNGKPVHYWKNRTGGVVPLGAGEVILANCTEVIVENQYLINGSVGIEVGFSENIVVINNNISYNNMFGIYIEHSNYINLSNNTVISIEWEGISIYYSNNISLFDNFIFKSGDAIRMTHSNDNIIVGNHVTNNYFGISGRVNRNYISENYVCYNMQSGIGINGRYNIVIQNNASHNDRSGIRISSSQYNEISYNNASFNNESGLYLSWSDENNITGNLFLSNENGIQIDYNSRRNSIYHNNIMINMNQSYDYHGENHWDNGYPGGGNYWSDYVGVDFKRGPNQDQPGSDGIGDTPQSVITKVGEVQDNYPLMEPWTFEPLENYTILKQGWNLISIPLIQEDQNLITVLGSVDGWYDAVQWYESIGSNDPWKHHKVDKSFGNDLFELNETIGFWIHITNPGDTIFLYNGTLPSENRTILLEKGWNQVGYPSLTNHNRTTGLNNLQFGPDVDAIQWYDAVAHTWHFMGPDENFEIGRGYWVHSRVNSIWEVPL
jgi:parallel beta-helix repeat protein